jgi:hypothetical protein
MERETGVEPVGRACLLTGGRTRIAGQTFDRPADPQLPPASFTGRFGSNPINRIDELLPYRRRIHLVGRNFDLAEAGRVGRPGPERAARTPIVSGREGRTPSPSSRLSRALRLMRLPPRHPSQRLPAHRDGCHEMHDGREDVLLPSIRVQISCLTAFCTLKTLGITRL